jgi:hypothetical protein
MPETLADFTAAIERIVAGLEKKSRVLGEEERRRVAYHEMGHALVAASLPGVDPVHKVSIELLWPRRQGFGRRHAQGRSRVQSLRRDRTISRCARRRPPLPSGLDWTFLRANAFTQNFFGSAESIKGQGIYYSPFGSAAISFIDARDIGDVAAKVRTTDGHAGSPSSNAVAVGWEREHKRGFGQALRRLFRFTRYQGMGRKIYNPALIEPCLLDRRHRRSRLGRPPPNARTDLRAYFPTNVLMM